MNNTGKKLLAVIMGAAITASLGISALAADTTSDTGGLPAGSITAPADTTDPAYAAVKADYAKLVDLRSQEKTARQQDSTLSKSNAALEKQIRDEVKQLVAQARNASGNQAVKDEMTTLKQQRQTLMQQIADARKNKDEAALTSLKSQLQTINTQLKADQQKLKDNTGGKEAAKDLLAKLNTLNSQIEALRAQMATADADIRMNQSKIDADWNNFTTAMQSKDYVTADKALQEIMGFKQTILSDLSNILGLKQQVTTLLNSFLTGLGTTTAGTGTAGQSA